MRSLAVSLVTLALLVPLPVGASPDDRLRISLSDFETVFTDPRTLKASSLVNNEKYDGARDILLRVGVKGDDSEHVERLRFLMGYALTNDRQWNAAHAVLDGLETDVPVIAHLVSHLLGRTLAAMDRHREAVSAFSSVPKDSTVGISALLRKGDSLMALHDAEEALEAYGNAMDAGRGDPIVVGKMASSLIGLGNRDEAIRILREAYFGSAVSGRASMKRMLKDLGVELDPTQKERLEYARALLDVHGNDRAISEARPLLDCTDKTVMCGALFVTGKALSKLRRHDEALGMFEEAIRDCEGHIDMAYTIFNAVRSAFRSGKHQTADALSAALSKDFPSSSLNDDVSIWRARRRLGLGDVQGAEAILLESLKSWPDGDMANESRWLLAWGAVKVHAFGKALRRLTIGARAVGNDQEYGSRFSYWLARTLELSGERGSAGVAYLDCVRDFPMTYYSFLALNRLAGSMASRAGEYLRKAASAPPVGPYLSISGLSDRDLASIGRIKWLMQTGLASLAADEARHGGLSGPDGAWLTAMVLDQGGSYTRSHRTAHKALIETGGFWPDSLRTGYYRLSYPRPFKGIVEKVAGESGLDPFLIWAVMREESAFVPGIESRSNAIGLMQLIMPTARAMARRLGLRATERTLRRPDVNIRLGAAYLSRLLKRFGEPLLAIPGYNAGGGAISRWLSANRGVSLDTFVESIAAHETRDYARKVFRSFAVYRLLYEEGARRFTRVRFRRR